VTARKREQLFGGPVAVKRRGGHEIAEMPWPQPCAVCGRAARFEFDGRRLCRSCLRKEEGRK
jgi:hypothetical protein